MENKGNNRFEYTYTAPTEQERREIISIRNQYADPETNKELKLMRLRRLDATVNNTATAISLILGVGGLMIFGLGMTMILHWSLLVFGILVAIAGCVPMGIAYYSYKCVFAMGKKKYGEEILKLSEELLSEFPTDNGTN